MNKQNTRPVRRVLAVILSLALLLTFTPLSGVVSLTASAYAGYIREGTYIYDEDGNLIYDPGEIHMFFEYDIGSTLILWVNWDGEVLEIDENAVINPRTKNGTYNGSTPTRLPDEENTYTFDKWHREHYPEESLIINTAQYTAHPLNCTVTWKNADGTVLKTDTVNYGETPSYSGETPTKPATAQYTYTFTGWSPAVTAVTEDQTYTAQFSSTVNKYTVTWKNGDTTLRTDTVEYGKTPSYSGETPAKPATAQYTYTFTGWSPAVTAVTGNQTYTAQFSSTVNKYTVIWKNGDGSTLKTEQINYGETPSYSGETPTKASDEKYNYTFKAWSPAITTVSDNVTYTAEFTKTPIATHFSQEGDTYTIHDATGWDIFCDLLADNAKGYFTRKTVKLADDITVSRMAGGSQHDFTGTFDGNGKTLTFNYTTDADYAAPFRNAESGCVIENLHVAGTIATSAKFAAGIIGNQFGTVIIRNCHVSVTINSSVKGDGTHGGFVAIKGYSNSAKLTIEGCVFDGKIVSTGTDDDATTSCGGFVGWKKSKGSLTITNSLCAPTADDNAVAGGATFARNWTMPDNANCYYTAALGTAQGKQAFTITPGADVTLGLSGDATEYDVSGITAYADNSGIWYGNNFYAGNGDTVELSLNYTGTPAAGYTMKCYTASAGTLDGTTLTMPAEDVTINANVDVESYFDEETGTFTLKGIILNNKGIILPNGVDSNDVLKIVVDSSGATLPQDSSYLFSSFDNVTSIDLTGADTSSVTDMNHIFYDCISLTTLNVSSFDTRNVTNMSGMFENCASLKTLDLSSFDTSSVYNMDSMFTFCENLTELDLSSFITRNVTNMYFMFCDCENLTELDLSSFDTSKVTNMVNMFCLCYKLTAIYVSEKWSTDSLQYSYNMFGNCECLRGGSDTAFDEDYTDKTYARIDKEGQPGYLTGVYSLILTDHMEIVTDANENMMVGSRYLKGAVVTVKAKTGYAASNVKANGTDLTADENGVYTVTVTENTEITALMLFIGDVNLDGRVDIRDVTAIQRHLADLEPLSGQALALADTNGDGEVDISDATRLQMYLAEYDVVLGRQPA